MAFHKTGNTKRLGQMNVSPAEMAGLPEVKKAATAPVAPKAAPAPAPAREVPAAPKADSTSDK